MAYRPSVEYIAEKIRELQKEKKKNILVAVGGPGGSGKSSLAEQLKNQIPESALLHTDDYRLPRNNRSKNLLGSNPKATNINLLISHLENIQQNKSFQKPIYNSITGMADLSEKYVPESINLIDGELSTIKELSPLTDIIIFLKTSLPKQLSQRLKRDLINRKYSLSKSLFVFIKSNLIDYKVNNYKTKSRADIIVKRYD